MKRIPNFYDHADRLMNTTQGSQVVKIDDQVKDPTYIRIFLYKQGNDYSNKYNIL